MASGGSAAITSSKWRELLVVGIATAVAFVFGYIYAVDHHPLPGVANWWKTYLRPALNYACTGPFGELRPGNTPPADFEPVTNFVEHDDQVEFSCDSIPASALRTSFFAEGLDNHNVEQPLYLTVVYAILWRLFGVNWAVTNCFVSATVALSFLAVYLCARGFLGPFFSAASALIFISNPFYMAYAPNLRDALKVPFAVAIAALLIWRGTAARSPIRFVAFAAGIGLLIGVGYGFRSDIAFFLLPAAVIIATLGQIDIISRKLGGSRAALASLGVRGAALAALVLSFGIGAWMPLYNDYVFHKHSADAGYHPMAMGLLGHTRHDLYQRDRLNEAAYMFRNFYNHDIAVGVRIMEYAGRRNHDDVEFAKGPYWSYAKRYYIDVVSLIPADVVSGAIGAFVNLMSLPRSLKERQSFAFQFDRSVPWMAVYNFARDGFSQGILKVLDRAYGAVTGWPLAIIFAANLLVSFVFLCLIAHRFGFRAAIATVVLLGAVLAVTSLKFEMRHMFYVYAFPLVAWAAVAWLIVRSALNLRSTTIAQWGAAASTAAMVATLLLALCGAVVAVLLATRAYQANALSALMADWAARPRMPARTEMSEVRPGITQIHILSPIPLSRGGQRQPDAPPIPRIDMGVIAVNVDRKDCAGRDVAITATGESNHETEAFSLSETFIVRGPAMEHVVYAPAFYYLYYTVQMHFAGLEVETQNVPCIKSVSLVTEFKKSDVLFDFVIPKDLSTAQRAYLYQHVYIPGVGLL
jgi:hypothetical protein